MSNFATVTVSVRSCVILGDRRRNGTTVQRAELGVIDRAPRCKAGYVRGAHDAVGHRYVEFSSCTRGVADDSVRRHENDRSAFFSHDTVVLAQVIVRAAGRGEDLAQQQA